MRSHEPTVRYNRGLKAGNRLDGTLISVRVTTKSVLTEFVLQSALQYFEHLLVQSINEQVFFKKIWLHDPMFNSQDSFTRVDNR